MEKAGGVATERSKQGWLNVKPGKTKEGRAIKCDRVGGPAGRGKGKRLGNRATLAVLSYIKAEGIRWGRGG